MQQTTAIFGVCALAALSGNAIAQLMTYTWPEQATFSDKYKVFVKCGLEPEHEVQVLMSHARYGGDYRARALKGRTFSFVSMSYGGKTGPLQVRVVKTFGRASGSVAISPRSYGIDGERAKDGKEVSFSVGAPNRYISVNFAGRDNQVPKLRWIRHMLCIFVDPLETEIPKRDGPGVVVYSREADPDALRAAKTVYFPPGHHNLRDYGGRGIIDADGQLKLQDRQALYLAGGAFVEGLVEKESRKCKGQRVYGRGLLTGRQYLWRRHPDHTGPQYRHILGLGNQGRVEGVTIIESPNHGIVGWTTKITNVKMLGWHCNNDCVRVGSGSEVSHSFFRAVDDHFYNFNIHVHDVVLWAGHNGAILTYGWGGGKGERAYNAGSSLFENVDIINPEWTGLGNNNGVAAAQVGLDYRPYGYGGDTTTILRNIRIEGSIPGLINLKPRSGGKRITALPVADSKVGYLGDLILENVTVDGQFGKGRLQGMANASTDGNKTFYVQNVQFKNVRIGGKPVTESNKREHFDIDPQTTRGITFAEE